MLTGELLGIFFILQLVTGRRQVLVQNENWFAWLGLGDPYLIELSSTPRQSGRVARSSVP